MPQPRGSTRLTGLIIAAITAAVFVGVVVWAMRTRREAPVDTPPDVAAPPDIKDAPTSIAGHMPAKFARSGGFSMDIADRKDPARLAGLLTAAAATALEGHNYALVKPEAWSFQRGGRVARITSDTGKAYIPGDDKGTRPESAILEGHVNFELYEKTPGGRPVNPASDTPIVTGAADNLHYDGTLGDVTTEGRVHIVSTFGEFAGRGLKIQFNEADQRLEYLLIEHSDEGLTYTPRHRPKDAAQALAPGAAPTAKIDAPATAPTAAPPAPAPTPAPVTTYYHITARGGVVVTQAGRRIEADGLEAWVRTVNNRIEEGRAARGFTPGAGLLAAALAGADSPLAMLAVGAAEGMGALEVTGGQPETQPPAQPREKPHGLFSTEGGDAPVHLAWTGPLEIRTLAQEPAQLAGNQAAVRFTADAGRTLAVTDEKSGARATGAMLDYASPSRDVALAGREGQAATLMLPETGDAASQRFAMNLISGAAHTSGASTMHALPRKGEKEPQRPRRVAWNGESDFQFAVVKGEVTSRLERADLHGAVLASDAGGEARGESLAATFSPVAGGEPDRAPVLSHITMTGAASAADTRGGAIGGDVIDADFLPVGDGSRSDPTHVIARGNATAVRRDARLASDFLDATLAHDGEGRVVTTDAVARGDVRYTGADGVRAEADVLVARPVAEIVDLLGEQVMVAQRGTGVDGSHIRLEGAEQRLTVLGAGHLTHRDDPESGRDGAAEATWTNGMRFEDGTGVVDCDGAVTAKWDADPLSQDTITAQHVRLWLTPGGHDGKIASAVAGVTPGAETPDNKADVNVPANADPKSGKPAAPGAGRRVLKAEAVGGEGSPAKVESRRFAMENDARKLERLLYLESAEVDVDDAEARKPDAPAAPTGVLSVPGAGRLLIVDRRAPDSPAPAAPSAAPTSPLNPPSDGSASNARGNALFTWEGSMKLNRGDGTAEMKDKVHLTHDRLADSLRTEVECDQLTAKMRPTDKTPRKGEKNGEKTVEVQGDLSSVDASGSVWIRSGQRELVADTAAYDTDKSEISASAGEGRNVTFFDGTSATPITARVLFWDIKSGRIEVRKPGTVVTPR